MPNTIKLFFILFFVACVSVNGQSEAEQKNNMGILPPTAITGPLKVCAGIGVQYSCSPPLGTVAHWSVQGGIIVGSTTGNTVLVAFNPGVNTTTNPYSVSVYYEQGGCSSTTLSTTILLDKPTVTPLPNTTVCGSSYATYTIPDVQADSYTWSITPSTAGSIESGQNSNSIHVLWNQSPQIATIKLTIRKCNINYPFTITTVTIVNAPTVTLSGPTYICSGTPANFSFTTVPAGSSSSVLWHFGDGSTSTSASPSYQYHAPTNGTVGYTVTATVSGAGGCLMDAIGALPVTVAPSPVVAISPMRDLNLCDPTNTASSFIYNIIVQGGFAATDHIAWYKDGVLLPSVSGNGAAFATLNVQSYGIGSYHATITNSYQCTANSATFVVYNQCPTGLTVCTAPYIIDGTATNTACQEITGLITSMPGSPVNYGWVANGLPASCIISSNNMFLAQNVPPGKYSLTLNATYNVGGTNCSATKKDITVIVPYHADLKYTIQCGSDNTYNVTLLDYSTYYAELPSGAIHYSFTTDGGANWYAGTPNASGIYQYAIPLPTGTHVLGIKTTAVGFAECTKYITINLPNKPNAAFSIDPAYPATICAGTPIHVTPTYPQPDYHYLWGFGDTSTNLQPNSVKTYAGGPHAISLTITDPFGCVSTASNPVTVTAVTPMNGFFTVTPQLVCQGGTESIQYTSTSGSVPTHFIWYQNTVGATPYAVTISGENLNVTQTGYYPVYFQDSNGCVNYDINAPSASFIPTPDTPVITGTTMACLNSGVTLSIPVNNNVIYQWYLNGVVQPQWHNQTTITDVPATTGIYTYSVIATASASGTLSCSSAPGSIAVTVVDLPNMPQLNMTVVSCDPYNVVVSVANPQTDVGYYWSNGDVGESTSMTHDGPLQVRAVINECSVKTQLDLPTDLQALSWIFPKGCYSFCKDATGTVVGPLGFFEEWEWLENDTVVSSGHNSVAPLTHLTTGSSYAMHLDNGSCDLTTGTMSINSKDCSSCEFKIEIVSTSCVQANNQTIYQTTVTLFNPYTTAAWATFAAPNGEGSFTNNSSSLAPGLNTITLNFIGQVGFTGGTVVVSINAQHDGKNCFQQFDVKFPSDCQNIEDCKFDYKLGEVSCVKTEYGIIYHFVMSVNNPYAVAATTSITIPASLGTIAPSSVLSASGITTNDFYFYPSASFHPGGLPLTITSTIGTVNCSKNLDFSLTTDCPSAKPCEIKIDEINAKCQLMANGQYGYTVTVHFDNPYQAPTTILLTAPNGEGYFVPNAQQIPWSSSVQTFTFHPTNGFMGDASVIISFEGHYKDQICMDRFTIDFPKPCCPDCKTDDLEHPKANDILSLELAPNPASDSTTVYFNFATTAGMKTIILTDLLGKVLQQWQPEQSKGTLSIDCSHLSEGQYLVTLKQNNNPIQTAKLIKH